MIDDGRLEYVFDRFRIEPAKRLLKGPRGETIALTPKAFDLLHYLVAHPGEVIEKETLMSAVWGDRVVEENNLT